MIRFAPLLLLLVAGTSAAVPVTEIHYVMGTYLRISAEGVDAAPAMRACFADARRLDAIFSRFDPTSELTRVNAGEAGPVSADFARLLARALTLGRRTDGAFDVTVGALSALWRGPRVPAAVDVASARREVGSERVTLDGDRLRLSAGTQLDFDGIAKGFAVDRCGALLRHAGVRRALVSLGESSLLALGGPWRLLVRGADPERATGELRLRDQAASISATRRLDASGARRPHIIDTGTGTALGADAVGVVVAASATDAEAYSKALLLWGPEAAGRVERLGAAGAIYMARGRVRTGPRAAQLFRPFARPRPLPADTVALR